MRSRLASRLEACIKQEYAERSYNLGWRLLYSPEDTLEGARVAFIGLNPAGTYHPGDHAWFAMPRGSAYATEIWKGKLPGEEILQRQVLGLFKLLGESPEVVLAGNLVPFRSPDWKSFSDKKSAVNFGSKIWNEILAQAKPRLIITIGTDARKAICRLLDIQRCERVPLQWGRVSGYRGESARGTVVGLPHLSRYTVIDRAASSPGLTNLFRGLIARS